MWDCYSCVGLTWGESKPSLDWNLLPSGSHFVLCGHDDFIPSYLPKETQLLCGYHCGCTRNGAIQLGRGGVEVVFLPINGDITAGPSTTLCIPASPM